ncbi:MAG TPA: hypothetical protein VHO90_19330, partial [Bacteroidales bacterium]|nr:hypothetical protein [Bacteroidales bacterium]
MEKHSKIKSFKNLFLSGKYLLAVFFFIQGSTIFAQGYDIKLKIADLKNSQVILGHHFGGLYYPDDTLKLDTKGTGTFKKAKPLPQGMYFFLLPSKQIVDLLIGPDQTFSFEIDTLDFVKSAKILGSLDNELFYTYMKYQKKGSMLV